MSLLDSFRAERESGYTADMGRRRMSLFDLLMGFPAAAMAVGASVGAGKGDTLVKITAVAAVICWFPLSYFDWRVTLRTMHDKEGRPKLTGGSTFTQEWKCWFGKWLLRWCLYTLLFFSLGWLIALAASTT